MGEETQILITVDEAAERLGCHRATIFRWIRAGELRKWRRRLDTRTYVSVSELEVLTSHPAVAVG
jgi:excisionase family DNA binding protein